MLPLLQLAPNLLNGNRLLWQENCNLLSFLPQLPTGRARKFGTLRLMAMTGVQWGKQAPAIVVQLEIKLLESVLQECKQINENQ